LHFLLKSKLPYASDKSMSKETKTENMMISNSLKDTLEFGARLGKSLTPGTVIVLLGPLGAGKTALVKGMARGLGIKEEITSPSFTIISVYESDPPLYHVDLYRLKEVNELSDLGLEELIYGQGITVIEWPEKAFALLPEHTLAVSIDIRADGSRKIQIQGLLHEYIGN
jgi:tRNA threonylcarbamoyladenosine biosynthesis protein TsaE